MCEPLWYLLGRLLITRHIGPLLIQASNLQQLLNFWLHPTTKKWRLKTKKLSAFALTLLLCPQIGGSTLNAIFGYLVDLKAELEDSKSIHGKDQEDDESQEDFVEYDEIRRRSAAMAMDPIHQMMTLKQWIQSNNVQLTTLQDHVDPFLINELLR
jgi:hypothetical protein